jgi:hypothetical protein
VLANSISFAEEPATREVILDEIGQLMFQQPNQCGVTSRNFFSRMGFAKLPRELARDAMIEEVLYTVGVPARACRSNQSD